MHLAQRLSAKENPRQIAKEKHVRRSGTSTGEVPDLVGRFNWGACLLTWIWAIGNRCLNPATVALTIGALIPYIGPIFAIVLAVYSGKTGSRRAWLAIKQTEDSFVRRQKRWTQAGLAVLFALLVLIVIGVTTGTR